MFVKGFDVEEKMASGVYPVKTSSPYREWG
jgi:hypothetical protein